MVIALSLLVGVGLGWLLALILFSRNAAGTLFFYEEEPGKPPIMMAELNLPAEEVRKCTHVIFEVSHK